MSRIEKLTPEQEAYLVEFRERYYRLGTSTEPADRRRAEEAIGEAYRTIGREPVPIIWCDSPLTASLLMHILELGDDGASLGVSLRASLGVSLGNSLRASLGNSLRDSLGVSLGASLGNSLGVSLWDSLGNSLGVSLWDSLGDSLWASLRASLGASLGNSLRASLGVSLGNSLGVSLGASLWASLRNTAIMPRHTYWWGQMDLYWIAFYLFCQYIGVQYKGDTAKRLQIMDAIGSSCGWWWPRDDLCIVSERPSEIKMELFDEPRYRWRPHCEDGPAIEFRDGWRIYAWHGVRVPEYVIIEPDRITVDDIRSEENAEVRRAKMFKYGLGRFLADSGATKEQDDGYGELYRIDTPDGPEKFVRVVNGTPEPDGTYRDYILPTWPDVKTAHEAVARSYGRRIEEYAPELRT